MKAPTTYEQFDEADPFPYGKQMRRAGLIVRDPSVDA